MAEDEKLRSLGGRLGNEVVFELPNFHGLSVPFGFFGGFYRDCDRVSGSEWFLSYKDIVACEPSWSFRTSEISIDSLGLICVLISSLNSHCQIL